MINPTDLRSGQRSSYMYNVFFLVVEQGLIECLKPPNTCCTFWDPESDDSTSKKTNKPISGCGDVPDASATAVQWSETHAPSLHASCSQRSQPHPNAPQTALPNVQSQAKMQHPSDCPAPPPQGGVMEPFQAVPPPLKTGTPQHSQLLPPPPLRWDRRLRWLRAWPMWARSVRHQSL